MRIKWGIENPASTWHRASPHKHSYFHAFPVNVSIVEIRWTVIQWLLGFEIGLTASYSIIKGKHIFFSSKNFSCPFSGSITLPMSSLFGISFEWSIIHHFYFPLKILISVNFSHLYLPRLLFCYHISCSQMILKNSILV